MNWDLWIKKIGQLLGTPIPENIENRLKQFYVGGFTPEKMAEHIKAKLFI